MARDGERDLHKPVFHLPGVVGETGFVEFGLGFFWEAVDGYFLEFVGAVAMFHAYHSRVGHVCGFMDRCVGME